MSDEPQVQKPMTEAELLAFKKEKNRRYKQRRRALSGFEMGVQMITPTAKNPPQTWQR